MDEARSGSKSSLLEFASLSSHEVPKRLQGARSTKLNNDVLELSLRSNRASANTRAKATRW